MRPYLLFVSGVAGLAGIALVEEELYSGIELLFAFIALFLGYGFGQALTDCFQIDTDSISAPYRPLCRGVVSKKSVGFTSLVGLISIGTILIYLNIINGIWALLSITGLSTYTYFKKKHWFTGPPYNSLIYMFLPLMGYFALSGKGFQELLNTRLLMIVALSFFSYINFVLIGYLKDINADRNTGYSTFPVKFGWNSTVWLGNFNLIVAMFVCFQLIDLKNSMAVLFFIAATVIGISGQLYALLTKNKKESNAGYPIISTVRALILWHLSIVVNFHTNWFLYALFYYGLFEISLMMRPEKNQI